MFRIAVVVAVLCAGAFAAPVDPLVSMDVTPKSAVIAEGRDVTLTFSLKEPIQCSDPDPARCKVVFLLSNTRPDDLALSACHVEWNTVTWKEERTIVVSAVEDFRDDGEKTYTLVTEPMISDSEFYHGVNPPDIEITTQSRPTALCTSVTDPHYNTFDGKAYINNNAGTFVLWQARHRDFEVQTRVSNGRNCGTAVRDGCDVIVLDSCATGDLVQRSNIVSPAGQRPTVQVRNGNTYIITSPETGAEVKVVQQVRIHRKDRQACGWSGCRTITTYSKTEWQDVYVTAPGVDFGLEDTGATVEAPRTTGMCGSFDGNRNNDPDANSAQNFKIAASSSLFNRFPPCVPRQPPTPVDYTQCVYVPQKIQRPIISSIDLEDITEMIMNQILDEDDERIRYDFLPIELQPVELTEEQLAARIDSCQNAVRRSTAADLCLSIGVDIEKYVDNCVVDGQFQPEDADELVFGNIEAMGEECQFEALKNQALFSEDGSVSDKQLEIVAKQCPGQCGFDHGNCINGVCVCAEGWTGTSCAVSTTDSPNVTSLFPHRCDSRREQCEHFVAILGEEFFATDNISCSADGETAPAHFVSETEVRCQLPPRQHIGAEPKHVDVSLTINGDLWSETLAYTYFDSLCVHCTTLDGCVRKPGSCAVDGACYLAGNASADNPCLTCQPEVDSEGFSFSYDDAEQCGVQLRETSYSDTIREGADADTPVMHFSAGNRLVQTDPNFAVEFSLSSEAQGKFVLQRLTGFDYALRTDAYDFDYETQHIFEFEIVVTDQAGNEDRAPVTVELLNANDAPSLTVPLEGFDFEVTENAPPSAVFTAVATDPDAANAVGADNQTSANPLLSGAWGEVTYHLEGFRSSSEAALFDIDMHTGVVTTTAALNYESRASYEFKLLACDGAFECDLAHVTIEVKDVNEAPTFIRLDGYSVSENAAVDTVVGYLVTTDEDQGQTHSYTLDDDAEGRFGTARLDNGRWAVVVKRPDLNFETGRRFDIVVRSTDDGLPAPLSLSLSFGILLTNANDGPTGIHLYALASASGQVSHSGGDATAPAPEPLTAVAENVKAGTPVGYLVVQDEDTADRYRFELVADPNNSDDAASSFQVIDGQLVVVKPFDYETATSHSVTVRAIDLTVDQKEVTATFVLAVADVNDAPKDITLVALDGSEEVAVDEFAATPLDIGVVSARDDDANQDMVLTLADGAAEAKFRLSATSCAPQADDSTLCRATLSVASPLDFETAPKETLTVVATSQADGLFAKRDVEVFVVDGNDAPTGVTVDPDTLTEYAATGTPVGVLMAPDPDVGQQHTFALAAAGLFDVVADTDTTPPTYRLVFVGQPSDVHFETQQLHNVEVTATDNGSPAQSVTTTVPVQLLNRPLKLHVDLPMGSLAEFVNPQLTPDNRVVGSVRLSGFDLPAFTPLFTLADDFGGAFALGPVADQRRARREDDGDGDVSVDLVVVNSSKIDAETLGDGAHLEVRVDFEGPTDATPFAPKPFSTPFELPVSDQNEAPVLLPVAPATLNVESALGTVVTALTVADPDEGDAHVFTLLPQGNDEGLFGLDTQGRIYYASTPSSLDFDERSFLLNVLVTDRNGLSHTATVPVTLRQESGTPFARGPADSGSGSSMGLIAGVVIAVLIIVAIVVAVVVVRRQKQVEQNAVKAMQTNALYDEPSNVSDSPAARAAAAAEAAATATKSSLVPGRTNPLYEWYQPELSREDCVSLLEDEPVGAFLIRDYTPTPGWHMMHTKLPTMVRDDKIRQNPDGRLQICSPPIRGMHPSFGSLPQLVKYYASAEQLALPVPLHVSDPIYDNRAMGTGASFGYDEASPLRRDANAPMVPLKNADVSAVSAVAGSDEMYFNAAEAKSALMARQSSTRKPAPLPSRPYAFPPETDA
eukprot:m.15634 g.15634  ORF g.15634 m.15634 type:complete len:1888 (-) comp5062_c1_seq1:107-5770(-)